MYRVTFLPGCSFGPNLEQSVDVYAGSFNVDGPMITFHDNPATYSPVAAFPSHTVSGVQELDEEGYDFTEDADWDDDGEPLTEEKLSKEMTYRMTKSVESAMSSTNLTADPSHYVPFVDWKAGFASPLPSEQASMKLKQQQADQQKEIASSANEATWHNLCEQEASNAIDESAVNEAQIVSEHCRDEKGDWSSAYLKACLTHPSLAELLNEVDEAQARVDARFAEITARMKQESAVKQATHEMAYRANSSAQFVKEALDELCNEDYSLGPRPKPVTPNDSDLCSFENVVAGVTYLRGLGIK